LCIVALAAGTIGAAPVLAQNEGTSTQSTAQTNGALIRDYIHYVLIARPDLAKANADAVFASGIEDADLYRLVDDLDLSKSLDDAIVRSMRIDELKAVAAEFQQRLDSGRLAVARDPDEIARHVGNLLGTARARKMAGDALRNAGDYAVPQLLNVLTDSTQSRALKTEVLSILASLGPRAVGPLTAALPFLDGVTQEAVCDVLGQIGYGGSLPALLSLSADASAVSNARTAAARNYVRLGGKEGDSLAGSWLALGEAFWAESESLIAWPAEPENNVWSFRAGSGLVGIPVPTSIYSEVMVMRCAREALAADPSSAPAAALWVAANFRRVDQIGGATDPTYGADMRAPQFYAVTAGPGVCQAVLARAIDDLNAPLARHAIAALASNAGGASLWSSGEQPSPLVRALDFPERRVAYDAALVLAKALPAEPFPGSDRVVPVLGSAVRTGDAKLAAVIASSEEDQRAIAANLRGMGFTVIPPRASYEAMRTDLADVVGVDLFVTSIAPDAVSPTVAAIHADPRLAATPVLAMVDGVSEGGLRGEFESDRRVSVTRVGLAETQLRNAVLMLAQRNNGDFITADEAANYTASALQSLRDIAIRNTPAYSVAGAETALIGALNNLKGDVRLTAADTLAWINTQTAQFALIEAALGESDPMLQVSLMSIAGDSARRWGSHASDKQIESLRNLVAKDRGPVGTAAAETLGAMNQPASSVVAFINSKR